MLRKGATTAYRIRRLVILADQSEKINLALRRYAISNGVKAHSNEFRIKNFSFITHPEETIKMLSELYMADFQGKKHLIHFDDSLCLDIAPYMVFAIMRSTMRSDLAIGGRMSLPIGKVLEAVEMPAMLNMRLPRMSDHSDVWPIPIRYHDPRRTQAANLLDYESQRDKTCRVFSERVEGWLNQVGFGFTDQGGNLLRVILGELLDNGRHAARALEGKDGAWVVAGFMARRTRPDRSQKLECHIGIITVGDSFAESLRHCPDPKILANITGFVDKHKGVTNRIDEDALTTQAALFDEITCDPGKGVGGGCGMSVLIRTMNQLGSDLIPGEEPAMTIISGSSCLRIMYPFAQMTQDVEEGGTSWYIAFNKENRLDFPPDDRHVYSMSGRFPGTIVTLRFVIDRKHLLGQGNGADRNGG
jgi:hypothetical protein